jgi:hypothetical protein
MNWKIALTALVTLAVAPFGCGEDDCSAAQDHIAQCAPTNSAAASSSTGMVASQPTCDGFTQCKAVCTNQATCEQINGNDPTYIACLVGCNGK